MRCGMSFISEAEDLVSRIVVLYGDVYYLRERMRDIIRAMDLGRPALEEKLASTDVAIRHKKVLIAEWMHKLRQVMSSEGYATECRLKSRCDMRYECVKPRLLRKDLKGDKFVSIAVGDIIQRISLEWTAAGLLFKGQTESGEQFYVSKRTLANYFRGVTK